MIFIRKFKSGSLVNITTWGCCDAFGDFIPRTLEQSIQINITDKTKAPEKTASEPNGKWSYCLLPV